MKIIGGTNRGKKTSGRIKTAIRPTSAKVREALFDIISGRIVGARFLDLYCGTGLIGLEALSRGAGYAAFVDMDTRYIEKNLSDEYIRRSRIYTGKAATILNRITGPFDIIYIDPPYGSGEIDTALNSINSNRLLAENGLAFAERFHKEAVNYHDGLKFLRSYRYGDTVLDVYEHCNRQL